MSRDVDDGSVSAAAAEGGSGGEAVAGGGEPADSHENDLVMPGFRFHPTEEELIEFYLRRKVEGKRFNVELITFLDLYRFDPWELPAMAVIGEKEWFFYVPRDRKYRNGDRPNRVTASGYWKATGADRMIRGENNRPIGLKKTLVFYSGKAPKGVRSSWIMNEYRLPPPATDADLFYKSEISLCRVYKRSGIDDGHGRPFSSNVHATSARPGPSRTGARTTQHLSFPPSSPTQKRSFHLLSQGECSSAAAPAIMDQSADVPQLQPQPPPHPAPCAYPVVAPTGSATVLACTYSLITMADAPMGSTSGQRPVDELSRLVGHSQAYADQSTAGGGHFLPLPQPMQPVTSHGVLPMSPATVSDKLWDWNLVPDTTPRDYSSSSFK